MCLHICVCVSDSEVGGERQRESSICSVLRLSDCLWGMQEAHSWLPFLCACVCVSEGASSCVSI